MNSLECDKVLVNSAVLRLPLQVEVGYVGKQGHEFWRRFRFCCGELLAHAQCQQWAQGAPPQLQALALLAAWV